MKMPFLQPVCLCFGIEALSHVSKVRFVILNEPVTSIQTTFRRHSKVASSGATRVRPVCPFMDLLDCGGKIGECVSLSTDGPPFELFTTLDHLVKHVPKRRSVHLIATRWSMQHRREPNAMESQTKQFVQCLP